MKGSIGEGSDGAEALAARPSVAALVAEGEARLEACGIAAARLEAEVLLARRLSARRSHLLARGDETPRPEIVEGYRADLGRRASRYPLQYITGTQEFFSLPFEVNESVLIPRAETEMIVEEVLRLAGGPAGGSAGAPAGQPRSEPSHGGAARSPLEGAGAGVRGAPLVIDVGTGSGCIAVSLAVSLPAWRFLACDISPRALEVARRNARRHRVEARIRFFEGDGLEACLEALGGASASFVVSNPPYVSEEELSGLQPELRHEPRLALSPGRDGLEMIERLVSHAPRALAPGGWLLIELPARRSEQALRRLDPALWEQSGTAEDLQGLPRLLRARLRS